MRTFKLILVCAAVVAVFVPVSIALTLTLGFLPSLAFGVVVGKPVADRVIWPFVRPLVEA